MRIGIDLRPLQTQQSRNRGVGAYIRHQVGALLEIALQDELLLFYSAALPAPPLLDRATPGAHWHAVPLDLPARLLPGQTISLDDDFVGASHLQTQLLRYDLDVFHLTNPFEWEVAIGQGVTVCPMITTLYDLILLIFASRYLSATDFTFRALYLQRLQCLKRSERVMAISEASRQDAVDLLGMSPVDIDVVRAGVAAYYQPLSDAGAIKSVRAKFKLPPDYVLSVLGYHYTKNIDGAIIAYSHLPASLRARVPLLIVCRLGDRERGVLMALAERYGVRDRVMLAGEVSQDDLVTLYNGATVFFYPSRYDGWGLPIVEAMRCGTPVLTTAAAALPEAAGNAALMGNPEDHEDLAAKLALLLTDDDLRQQLRERGIEQAKHFSWQRAAKETLQIYHHVVEKHRRSRRPVVLERGKGLAPARDPSRLRVAYWSPLNPCPSGISDYSEQLLLHLVQYMDLDIFVHGYAPNTDLIRDNFAIYDYKSYSYLREACHYDINLYQMGNSPLHTYIYEALLREPGVVVLHDYILQALVYSFTEAVGQRERYLDEIAYSEGEGARAQALRDLREGRGKVWYTYPLNRRVVEASQGVIVHSRWVQSKLSARVANLPIAVVPQGAKVLAMSAEQRSALRSSLGLDPAALVIGCFGYIAPVKRIKTVLRAFRRLRAIYPRAVLLLVGAPDDEMGAYLQKAAGHLGDSVQMTGFVTPTAFDNYLQVSDICVNLRYPTAGETSSTLCRALGAGLPVLASDLPQFAEFPDDCVWKVAIGDYEEEELVAYLLALAFDASLRRRMSQAAQAYIAEHATWSKVAAHYARFLHQVVMSLN